ncbi:MAG: HAMP domain-containing sensor histidine kinase [Myxococcales bacterium]|nr:HAMP domain-containing sensor histidine kinase [Myxococcales bacterium]
MGGPLGRLRLAFGAVALAVLAAVGVLLQSALNRLDEQQRLRHRMVAERVFDEVERELSALIDHESKRPSEAYDAETTNVQRWSPFVVGYYRLEAELALVAEPQLEAARRTRLRGALSVVRDSLDASPPDPTAPGGSAEPLAQRTRQSSPEVLRQLNRGAKVRKRLQERATAFRVVEADARTLVAERLSPTLDRREGLVLDVERLISTIQTWVLTAQGLDAVAHLEPGDGTPPAAERDDEAYYFSHQLAPPLEARHVSLRLSRLDDRDESMVLYGLAALLTAAVVLGLLALYRVVAVQVRFAERRNNFVSAVSHELKTPLTAIRMYGEMLRDGMVEGERQRQDYYRTITAEGERLTRLINNVMEHGQLRRGQRHMHVSVGNVGPVVRDVVSVMRPHIEHEGFTVELDVPDDLPSVKIDDDALRQVLFNVLDNALKYGREGEGGTLRVSCEPWGKGVLVRVRDHGPGVSESHLQTIFEPFFRAEDELTRRRQGTGIGLSLARDLVERMHGKVTSVNCDPGLEVRIALSTT